MWWRTKSNSTITAHHLSYNMSAVVYIYMSEQVAHPSVDIERYWILSREGKTWHVGINDDGDSPSLSK